MYIYKKNENLVEREKIVCEKNNIYNNSYTINIMWCVCGAFVALKRCNRNRNGYHDDAKYRFQFIYKIVTAPSIGGKNGIGKRYTLKPSN